MSFNRTSYDEDAYKLKLQRSQNPGNYMLFERYGDHCEACYPNNSFGSIQGGIPVAKKACETKFDNLVTIDSQLSWRRKVLSKNNDDGILPDSSLIVKREDCKNLGLVPEDTRFTNPIDNFRSMDTTSYKFVPYLSVNPQNRIQTIDERIGVVSRLSVKDAFANAKISQEYWDKGEALPKPRPQKC